MKKTFKVLGLIALTAVFIASCKPDQTNDVVENGKATVNGTAYVNLDFTDDTTGILVNDFDKAPSGTVLYAKINSEDLVLDPAGGMTYADIYYTTTVDGNGNFSFSIDANSRPVSVQFSADDFRKDQFQLDSTFESVVFYLPTSSETVYKGVTKITQLVFDEK